MYYVMFALKKTTYVTLCFTRLTLKRVTQSKIQDIYATVLPPIGLDNLPHCLGTGT